MDAEDEANWEAAQKLYQSGPAVKTVLGSILNNNRGSVTTEPLQAVANKMAKWGRSIADLTDVEARWKRMKADATGLAVKTFHSVSQSYEDIAMKVATDIVKEVKRAYPGITKGKAHDELLADVVLGAEKKETFDSWSVEKQNKLRKPVSMLRKYFDDSLAQYQENGIEGIDYYKNKIAQQRKAMGKMKDINQMSDMNRKLGELEKLSFVHLPKSQWFPGADTRDTRTKRQMERAKKRRAFDILVAKRKRHAVSMHDLVERGVLEKREIDPVSMLLNYGQQVGRDMAMVNLREAGLEDGFVSDAKTKPMSLRALNAKLVKLNENLMNAKGKRVQAIEKSITALEKKITALERVYNTDDTAQWEKMPSQEYSAFKGLWVDSRLRDALNNTLASDDRQSWYEKQVSTIKMAQFYNPIFMPIYDLWQAGAMGGLIRHPAQWIKNIGRAARDVEEVSDRHQRASQWGTFSKPFSNPIANRDKQVRAIKEATKYDGISGSLLDALKTLGMEQFTKRAVSKENRSILGLPVGGLYTAAWNSAWKMDAVIRQGTFNYLTERGMSDKEAAQTAAKIHADYAGVPAKTRKAMNKVIFTPTFAISMVKVQTAMVNEAIRFAMRRGQTKSQKQLALGAATTTATIVGMHLYMISQGYEPDKFGRVYTKTVDTPNGPREIKVNLTTPLTKGLKYLNWLIDYAYKPLTGGDPAKTEVLGDFMKTLSYEGTPLLRTIMGLKTNQKPNGDKIYYGMDKGYMKALKMTEYVMKDTLAFFDQGGQTFGRVNAEDNKELEKELGTMFLILKRMQTVFVSSRSDKDRRFSGALQGIKSDFEADVKQYMKRNPDGDLTPMMEEYERRLNQLQENYENE
jgi:hypothetical protein